MDSSQAGRPLSSGTGQDRGFDSEETFQTIVVGGDGSLVSPLGRFVVEGEGALEIMHPPRWAEGELALRLPGGEQKPTVLELAPGLPGGGTVEFACQRDARKRPFELRAILVDRDGIEVVHDLSSQVNGQERQTIVLPLATDMVQLRFEVTAPLTRGVWIDDLRFVSPTPMTLVSAAFHASTRPLVAGETVEVGVLEVMTSGAQAPLEWQRVRVIESVTSHDEAAPARAIEMMGEFAVGSPAGSGPLPTDREGEALRMEPGLNRFPVTIQVGAVDPGAREQRWAASARYGIEFQSGDEVFRPVPDAGEPTHNSWPAVRITPAEISVTAVSMVTVLPHLAQPEVLVCAVTTEAAAGEGGVGLYRSLDAGSTWVPVQAPEGSHLATEGALIYDLEEHLLHLLAERSSALVASTSSDAGATWTPWGPLNVESPKRLSMAGATGIQMSTGELVVPVVVFGGFRIEDEPCAGVLVSPDHGTTWSMHHAAYPNTTTSAVVEVGDGALLLNMTDRRGALRSERTTLDLGRTWRARRALGPSELHLSAGSDGALIHLGRARGRGGDGRMVFANASTEKRPSRNLVLKGSSDNAGHWPEEHRVLLDDSIGVDHPALAPVGATDVGVAYECGAGGVVFQRLPESVAVPRLASWFDVNGGR